MHYCINALFKNNNEIMQYCIIINDIALIMHYRALLQMPGCNCIAPLALIHQFLIALFFPFLAYYELILQ